MFTDEQKNYMANQLHRNNFLQFLRGKFSRKRKTYQGLFSREIMQHFKKIEFSWGWVQRCPFSEKKTREPRVINEKLEFEVFYRIQSKKFKLQGKQVSPKFGQKPPGESIPFLGSNNSTYLAKWVITNLSINVNSS